MVDESRTSSVTEFYAEEAMPDFISCKCDVCGLYLEYIFSRLCRIFGLFLFFVGMSLFVIKEF